MNCPVCSEKMKEIVKSDIVLDICPGCKGVWLDRGELERLMEFAATAGVAADMRPVEGIQSAPPAMSGRDRDSGPGDRRDYREGHKRDDHDDDDDDDHHGRQSREGHRGEDRYRGREGQQGQYPKRKSSWVSNIFDMLGGD